MPVVAMDLGGTKLSGAIVSAGGKLSHHRIVPLKGGQGPAVGELVLDQLRALLKAAAGQRRTLKAIAVAVPGISSGPAGHVWAPNIPGWKRYPLRREIERALGKPALPVVIESDRACCILGEAWRGAARGCRDAIFLAIGTGIGAGILVDGKVVRGAHGSAGALGWLALDQPFRRAYIRCGCFEHHASGRGLAKIYLEVASAGRASVPASPISVPRKRARGDACPPETRSSSDIFTAYHQHDPAARKVVAEAIQFWGMALANLVSIFNPEKVIFGGGVFGPAKRFLKNIRAEARKWAQPVAMKQVKLQPSALGADAGLYGAGYLALCAAGELQPDFESA